MRILYEGVNKLTDTNKPSNPLYTLLFKSPWSLRFSFIITMLLVLLSFANIVLFSFFGMQINSLVFLVFSLISFVFVFIASFKTTTVGKTTFNWIMFLVTVIAIIIVAISTNFFKGVPKVELDNISNTLIALSFGCTIMFAFYNNYDHKESISKKDIDIKEEEAEVENIEETAFETTDETTEDIKEETIEEASEENTEDITEETIEKEK